MKILLLATDAYGGHGGIAYYNRCLAQALAQMTEVSEVVVVARVMRFSATNIPEKIRIIDNSVGSKWRFVRAVAQLSIENFDLLICGHINLLPVAVSFAKLKHIPVILQVHGIDVWKMPTTSAVYWVRQVKKVWSVSGFTRDRMNTWAGLSLSNYIVIPNTVDLERYGLAPQRVDLVNRYKLTDKKVIVTLARLVGYERYKGIDEMLEIMPELLKEEPAFIYLILGDGNDKSRLQKKALDLGISESVIFVGFISETEKADYLRLGDIFALPGRGEGFGIVYLEALACGVPVVGSQLDGSREALLDGELGELSNPTDLANLKTCILKTLSKPKEIPFGLTYFNWPHFQERVRCAVQDVIAISGR